MLQIGQRVVVVRSLRDSPPRERYAIYGTEGRYGAYFVGDEGILRRIGEGRASVDFTPHPHFGRREGYTVDLNELGAGPTVKGLFGEDVVMKGGDLIPD